MPDPKLVPTKNYSFAAIIREKGALKARFRNAAWGNSETYDIDTLDRKIDELADRGYYSDEMLKGRTALQEALEKEKNKPQDNMPPAARPRRPKP